MIKNIINIGILLFFVNCNNQSNLKKEKVEMNNIKTYQEYILLKKWSLPSCKKNNSYKIEFLEDTIIYLYDGSKIEYECCIEGMDECLVHIFPIDKPFLEIQKTYSCNTKIVKSINFYLKNLKISSQLFNKEGAMLTNEQYLNSSTINYTYILKWAERKGFIDLKKNKILKGTDFKIYYLEFKDLSVDEQNEYFGDLTDSEKKLLFKYQRYWDFELINYNMVEGGYMQSYIFTDDGTFIKLLKQVPIVSNDNLE
jgi:hypothetical protein